ncbi:MAG TPA: chloride channel protein [Polyangia bacterium]|nr:chloride channel protein [Polyangia bacterium]
MAGGARWSSLGIAVLGAVLGGVVGGFVVVGVTLVLKVGMDLASRENTLYVVVVPLFGLTVATVVLNWLGRSGGEDARRAHPWRTFSPDAIRADISGDVIESEGVEERFPWRLAPIRALAIIATVGSGGAMGTEAPAAYLGVAAGACLGDRGRWWRRLLRPAALAGGAAGVSALMAAPLVGTVFMLELGLRKRAPVNIERSTAALVGGFIGWAITAYFHLQFIRLIVPQEPPRSFTQAAVTALLIGGLAGGISSLAGMAVNRAKKWAASPAVRLAIGGTAIVGTVLILARLTTPTAAVGPGGGAILWAENANALPSTLLCVCFLRAAATTAAVAAGGCGGVFVPFLAVGDIAGRVFAPGLEVGSDLAGAAGAAGGIAGGYRLPLTALVMVLSVGGPHLATLTCLATVAVAFYAGLGVEVVLSRLKGLLSARRQAPVH